MVCLVCRHQWECVQTVLWLCACWCGGWRFLLCMHIGTTIVQIKASQICVHVCTRVLSTSLCFSNMAPMWLVCRHQRQLPHPHLRLHQAPHHAASAQKATAAAAETDSCMAATSSARQAQRPHLPECVQTLVCLCAWSCGRPLCHSTATLSWTKWRQ